jgi:hypothetical protein
MAVYPVGKFRSGKGGRVSMNATLLKTQDWSVNDKCDRLDTTCFETNGQEQLLTGIEGIEISIKGDWNAQTNAFDSPPGIYPQDAFPNVLLYENIADAVFWNVPFMCILSANNGAQVRGKVTFSFDGAGQPGWTRPTGSAA